MNKKRECPRCGSESLEVLSTHSHCWECGYSPDEPSVTTRIRRQQEHEAIFGSHLPDLNESQVESYFNEYFAIKAGVR